MSERISIDSSLSFCEEVSSAVLWKGHKQPLARCSFCVMQYGDASKTDKLKLVTFRNRDYLACNWHRRRLREK